MKDDPNDPLKIRDYVSSILRGDYELSKREYFAIHCPFGEILTGGMKLTSEEAARIAVKYADDLIKELNKKE